MASEDATHAWNPKHGHIAQLTPVVSKKFTIANHFSTVVRGDESTF